MAIGVVLKLGYLGWNLWYSEWVWWLWPVDPIGYQNVKVL